MPHSMTYYPKAVVLKGRMYIGGGRTYYYASKDHGDMQDLLVMVYGIEGDTWTTLPSYA